MTTPSNTSSPGASPLLILSQIARSTAQMTQQTQISQISQDLQNQLNQQLANLQGPVDQVSIDYSQSQINSLQAQQKSVNAIQAQYGNNGLILADLVTQLGTLATAATNGDAAGFDSALTTTNSDVGDLGAVDYNPIFQSDGVTPLKTNGIGVQSSATYDLSTLAGQSAASTDVAAAQNLVNQIFKATSDNQVVGTSAISALNGQLSALQTLQSQQEQTQNDAVASETQTLTQNMQNELHIIELNLGKSSQISTALSAMEAPTQPTTSLFGALENAVGQTASNAQTQLNTNPAIMSLFA